MSTLIRFYTDRVITRETGGLANNPIESNFLAKYVVKLGQRNMSAGAMLSTSSGVVTGRLVPMLPHDNADRVVRVPLHSSKYPNLVALIDEKDAETVRQFDWRPLPVPNIQGAYYAVTHQYIFEKRCLIYMHRFVMNAPKGIDVDHVNGDRLDNRRSQNLRICSESQNSMNRRKRASASSTFKGVSWNKRDLKWQAHIRVDGKSRNLGTFNDPQQAARAYDNAARELFGKFACVNFPREGETLA